MSDAQRRKQIALLKERRITALQEDRNPTWIAMLHTEIERHKVRLKASHAVTRKICL